MYNGKCQACDEYREIDDQGFCQECSAQLDRDMIRVREWRYSVRAWTLSDGDREKLREQIIEQYGETLELIDGYEN